MHFTSILNVITNSLKEPNRFDDTPPSSVPVFYGVYFWGKLERGLAQPPRSPVLPWVFSQVEGSSRHSSSSEFWLEKVSYSLIFSASEMLRFRV